jgi:phosphoacetylglucosamine mutase
LNKKATYGTAGFRDLATKIPYIVFRVGAFVAILNKTSPSKCLGIVISASHNKREDNGVKITNFNGNML